MGRMLRTTGRLVGVVIVMAACLRVLDAVPRVLTGLPRGVVVVASLAEVRASTGVDVRLPSFYPATLDWPSRHITVFRGQEIAVTVRQRGTGASWLIVAAGPASSTALSPATLPPVSLLQDADTIVAGSVAQVQRVSDSSGAIWHQLTWREAGRTMVVRYRGGLDELLRIATSLRARDTS